VRRANGVSEEEENSGVIIVVMGVTGAGKTTVGRLLAEELGWEFEDGDDFHPAANVERMRRGVSLNEEHRRPWLERLRGEIARRDAEGRDLVLACSALKKIYRTMLAVSPAVKFVYLKGETGQIAERLKTRRGHFAGEKILAAQFVDLEEPESAVVVDISATSPEIVSEIRKGLGV
jgi:gluconokinase